MHCERSGSTTSSSATCATLGVVDGATVEYLAGYRFTGDVEAYAEGEVYFPGSPVLTVEGTFAECVVLETLVLSILNHDSAVATAATRMVHAAHGRPIIEMGSRRTHEEAAVASARAAHIAGFAATSNLAAGKRWGIPTTGTAAHAFTLVHDDERAAFTAQVAALWSRHHPARRHLRRPRRHPHRHRGRGNLARRDPARLRRPRGRSPGRATAARRARCHIDTHRRHERPQRTSDRGSAVRAGRRVRRGHLAGHRQRPPDRGLRLQAGRSRSPDGEWQPVAKRSVGKPSLGGRKSRRDGWWMTLPSPSSIRIGAVPPSTRRASGTFSGR